MVLILAAIMGGGIVGIKKANLLLSARDLQTAAAAANSEFWSSRVVLLHPLTEEPRTYSNVVVYLFRNK